MRFIRRRAKKAGSPPGTLIWSGEKSTEPLRLGILNFDQERLQTFETTQVSEVVSMTDVPEMTSWVDVAGLHDVKQVAAIGAHFGIHDLTLEDIVTVGQRPKVEVFETHVYVVFKMLSWDPAAHQVQSEQVSLVVGPRFVLSFQEKKGDVFDPVRERILAGKGRIRTSGSGYLAYALIDAVVDHYFSVLENMGDQIEALEERMMTQEIDDAEAFNRIHHLRREMIFLRKQVWPMREVVSRLMHGGTLSTEAGAQIFWSDVHDHTVQVIETVESFRDLVASLLDLHLSTASNRMNQVMKVLTIIATIFIPLTFIAGVYGMNFKYMPELQWRYGYALVWGLMLCAGIVLVLLFKRKKWW